MGALCFTLRSHFNVSCKVGLVVMNSQIFVCLENYLYFNSEEQLFQVECYWWQVFVFFFSSI